ncbi:hypothetical protein, partial [Pseudomonas nabeulensis]|uniref:hypothetical protein n=1 Tax=Pseudomonas nabeulensis TaxID=2293833 RepID=UPI001EE8F67D
GSTISSSKDVHGRLFLCLKSSKYGAFSTTSVHGRPGTATLYGIPNGIPSPIVLIFGMPTPSWNANVRTSGSPL